MGLECSRIIVDPKARQLDLNNDWPTVGSGKKSMWIKLPNGYEYTTIYCSFLFTEFIKTRADNSELIIEPGKASHAQLSAKYHR